MRTRKLPNMRPGARAMVTSSPRAPQLTARVLDGILAATSQILAGDAEGECAEEWENIEAADAWARAMRQHRNRGQDPTHEAPSRGVPPCARCGFLHADDCKGSP